MFGYDWPRFHAAVNDLPAALLFVTVLFDFAGWFTKRESLKAAALWTLWAGVIGGWIAVIAGLQAEDVIEHGEAIHELMETHETLALTTLAAVPAGEGHEPRGSRPARAERCRVRHHHLDRRPRGQAHVRARRGHPQRHHGNGDEGPRCRAPP